MSKVVLFYNRKSGHAGDESADQQKSEFAEFFKRKGIPFKQYDLPFSAEEVNQIVDKEISTDTEIFIAAGGDGTISIVGNALINKPQKLGILPLGTGNLLATELRIPKSIKEALGVITDDNSKVLKLDTFKFGDRNYILNLSIGLTPRIIEKTKSSEKQQLGILAYIWHFLLQGLGLHLRQFKLQFDGQEKSILASEIIITNGRVIGLQPLKWSDDVYVNDGIFDIFAIRAANIIDIGHFIISIFSEKADHDKVVDHFRFQKKCRVETKKTIPVQADGDPAGETPIQITVNPHSLNILVPKKYKINHK